MSEVWKTWENGMKSPILIILNLSCQVGIWKQKLDYPKIISDWRYGIGRHKYLHGFSSLDTGQDDLRKRM